MNMSSWLAEMSLEKLSEEQLDTLVPLSKESAIINTLCAFLVALVLRHVGGWINFPWLASPGYCYSHSLHSPMPENYVGAVKRMRESSSF